MSLLFFKGKENLICRTIPFYSASRRKYTQLKATGRPDRSQRQGLLEAGSVLEAVLSGIGYRMGVEDRPGCTQVRTQRWVSKTPAPRLSQISLALLTQFTQ